MSYTVTASLVVDVYPGHDRSRTKHSPSKASPTAMSRSSTSNGHSAFTPQHSPPQRLVHLPDPAPADDAFKSYPFPIPTSSLPSMRPQQPLVEAAVSSQPPPAHMYPTPSGVPLFLPPHPTRNLAAHDSSFYVHQSVAPYQQNGIAQAPVSTTHRSEEHYFPTNYIEQDAQPGHAAARGGSWCPTGGVSLNHNGADHLADDNRGHNVVSPLPEPSQEEMESWISTRKSLVQTLTCAQFSHP